jgi:fatty acid synthase subunit alpha
MWTAALARNLLDKFVTKKPYQYKVKNYQATFMEKVKPNEPLFSRMTHVGMKNGLKIIQVEILNENEVVVLKGLAEVEQPKPAYVFTGNVTIKELV